MKTTVLPPEGSRDLTPLPINSNFLDERMGGAVFEIDGIRFGLEICLDHLKNRLTGKENVDIQLVPSCGIEWKYGKYKCIQDGLYFGVDAIGPPRGPRVEVGRRGAGPPTVCSAASPGLTNFSVTPCSVGGDIVLSDPLAIA